MQSHESSYIQKGQYHTIVEICEGSLSLIITLLLKENEKRKKVKENL